MNTSDGLTPWFERLFGADPFSGSGPLASSAPSSGSTSAVRLQWLALALTTLPLALLATRALVAETPGRLFGALMSCSLGLFLSGVGFGVLAGENRQMGNQKEKSQETTTLKGGKSVRGYWWFGSAVFVCFMAGGLTFVVGLSVLFLQ
ncbi:hypothetical protein GGP66_003439 [Salinibacter ruber]|uniref:hypothetical protein n=1 Tax=Salinibacter ruber TaxID=146919 RepID=UPI002169EA51|nr:hypothetical protein [Salinibacter ruber]MCS3675983.1 hypothetical protein [Salinibacter ruber]